MGPGENGLSESASAVLTVIEKVGGGVATREIAYQLNTNGTVLAGALAELHTAGLIEPTEWQVRVNGAESVRGVG